MGERHTHTLMVTLEQILGSLGELGVNLTPNSRELGNL